MDTVNFADTITALEMACSGGLPWHAIANILSNAVVARERTAPIWPDFWERAQVPTGLSPVILKRYVRAFRKLEQIASDSRLDLETVLPQSFTAAEIAVRLHARDPTAGLQALNELRQPNRLGIEQLRKWLKEAPPVHDARPRLAVLAGREAAIERCGAIFAAAVPAKFGPGAHSSWRPPLRHFRRLGFEVRSASGSILSGADLYLSDAAARSDVLEDLATSVMLSLYLPAFQIVVGPGGPGTAAVAARAADVLDLLEARWIGIFAIDGAGSLVSVRGPSGHPPIDRTEAYAALVESLGGRRPTRP